MNVMFCTAWIVGLVNIHLSALSSCNEAVVVFDTVFMFKPARLYAHVCTYISHLRELDQY